MGLLTEIEGGSVVRLRTLESCLFILFLSFDLLITLFALDFLSLSNPFEYLFKIFYQNLYERLTKKLIAVSF